MEKTQFYEKRKAGRPVFGFYLTFPSPELVEFLGLLGFDYVFIDAEHFIFNPETIQAICRACELCGIVPIARLPRNEAETILGFLEAGVKGFTIPHVQSAEDARKAVRAVKYYPLGERSAGAGSRPARYGTRWSAADYYEQANRETLVIALLEDEAGFKNAAEILAVEGLDAVDFGPADCSLSMGLPGQPDHPRVQALIQQARSLALQAGKTFYAPVSSIVTAKEAIAAGAGFIELSISDLLGAGVGEFLKALRPEDR